jgi:hypothetical protein
MPKADQSNTMEAATTPSCSPIQTAYYTVVAAMQAAFDATAVAFMDEVRASATYLIEHHDYSLTSFSDCTGLHKNSLMRLKNDLTWMPKPETVQQLDKLIVRAEAKRRGEIFPGETIKRGRPGKAVKRNR